MLELKQVNKSEKKQCSLVVPSYLQPVLERYKAVFYIPTEFPPRRGHEHAIVMKRGSNLVSVRPYRYPQFQKDEIERLVREILEAGIIQPSTSPYSSPILLVKKRWLMAFLCRL